MKRITDNSFIYVNSAQTDIKKTFRRIRAELKAQSEAHAEAVAKVTPLTRKERK